MRLNAIELGIMTTNRSEDGKIHITLEVAQECIQKRAMRYDKTGDNHYDTISAFIKSMRGSDPDAAVYYLARMLYAGEECNVYRQKNDDLRFGGCGKRGPAGSAGGSQCISGSGACRHAGGTDYFIPGGEPTLPRAPKSNAANNAIAEAMQTVEQTGNLAIPVHLQDAHYKGAAKLGHGTGYKYAHDYKNNYVKQQYLPYELNGKRILPARRATATK